MAAFAITEPGSGSNPLAMSTTAVQGVDGNFVINGTKVWSGSAAWASVIHVFAKTFDTQGNALGVTGFAVEQGLDGLKVGSEALTMGMRGTCQSRVELNNVKVPSDAVLGKIGNGMEVAQDAMKFGRLVITAAAIGGMKRCAQLMVRYAQRRQVGTGLLLDNPVTLQRLQDLKHATNAIETLVNRLAQCIDRGIDVPIEIYAACKISGPEFFWEAADHLVQMLGGRGYIENNIAPQLLRDARILRIFEGPTETLSMYLGARINKTRDEYFGFIDQQFNGHEIATTLGKTVDDLASEIEQSGAFDKLIDAERWLYERCGRLAALATLKAALPASDKQTREWLENQYQKNIHNARDYLSFGQRVDGADMLATVAAYTDQIGDIEQRAASDDQALDDYLQREHAPSHSAVTPDINVSVNSEAEINGGAISHTANSRQIEQLNVWMRDWIAGRLKMSSEDISVTQDFTSFGLDSVDAVELTYGLSEAFGITVKADLAWLYPSISSASAHLAQLIKESESVATSRSEDSTHSAKWLEGEI